MERVPRTILSRAAQLVLVWASLTTSSLAQTVVNDEAAKEETTSSSSTDDRVMALLGGMGTATTEPAKTGEAPEIPARTHDRVSRCFQDAVRREVSLPGRVEVSVQLREGKVSSASLVDAQSIDLLLRECLVESAKATSVDAPDADFTWLFIPTS